MSYYAIEVFQLKLKTILTLLAITILTTTITPASADSSPLQIIDLSNTTYTFTYQQLAEMPKTIEFAALYCYGNLLGSGEWGGVQLSYLLNLTNFTPDVHSILFTASDQYKVMIPIEVAQAPQTIIAYEIDGVPLTDSLRLILPGYNGASWIAQIVSISMSYVEVATPDSITLDGSMSRNVLSSITGQGFAPTPTYIPPTATPKPTPNPPTATPTVSPTNNTEVQPTPTQQTENRQSNSLEFGGIVIIAAALGVGLLLAIFITHNRRNKISNNTCTIN